MVSWNIGDEDLAEIRQPVFGQTEVNQAPLFLFRSSGTGWKMSQVGEVSPGDLPGLSFPCSRVFPIFFSLIFAQYNTSSL